MPLKIMGIDPSLRNTGFGIVNYCPETRKVWVTHGGIIRTPEKFKGQEALMWMIQAIKQLRDIEAYTTCDHYVIETPASVFQQMKVNSAAVIVVANIAGAATAIFSNDGMTNTSMPYPQQWNKSKAKSSTREQIESLVGPFEEWDFEIPPKREKEFEHIVDAVGMAYWHLETSVLTKL